VNAGEKKESCFAQDKMLSPNACTKTFSVEEMRQPGKKERGSIVRNYG
jgi:hypothetical protein